MENVVALLDLVDNRKRNYVMRLWDTMAIGEQ